MAWNEAVVTNGGMNLLAKSFVDKKVVITRGVGGENCSDVASLLSMENIKEPCHELNLSGIENNEGKIVVNLMVQNNGLETEYTLKQIGLFAKLEDGSEEILFAVIQDKAGEIIPNEVDNPEFLTEFGFVIPVGNTENVKVQLNPNIFSTIEYVKTVRHEIETNAAELLNMLKEEIVVYLNKKPDCHVFAQRLRDKSKPDYGFVGSGEYGLTIETGEYTGMAEVAIIREDNTLLDAKNITRNTISAPEGTFIITEE